MTHIKFFRFPLLLVLLLSLSQAFAQDIPERPNPPRLVNDLANVLSPTQAAELENRLVSFNDSTSTQIVVVIVPSLNNLEKADFAEKLGTKWGVGQKKTNNGVVVLIKPKTQGESGEAFIAPGYGLEPVIPDATAYNIVNNEMIPRFKQNDYYDGINAGVETVMALARGEFTAAQYDKRATKHKGAGFLIPIIVLVIVLLMMRGGGGRHHSIGKSLPFWTMLMLMGSGNRGGGGFGGGGGGFGSGGGGGFGGFGGGGFGGGGAGGSW